MEILLSAKNISKTFQGKKVLDNINYAQSKSENHSIKNVVSNLIKIFN